MKETDKMIDGGNFKILTVFIHNICLSSATNIQIKVGNPEKDRMYATMSSILKLRQRQKHGETED